MVDHFMSKYELSVTQVEFWTSADGQIVSKRETEVILLRIA